MLTTKELTDELAAETLTAPVNLDRLEQVRNRVAVHRRRRAAGTGLASVVVLAAAAAVVVPQVGSESVRDKPGAGPSQSALGETGMPAYRGGGRLIADEERVGAEGVNVTFTPTAATLSFAVSCYVPGAPDSGSDLDMVTLSLDGEPVASLSCHNVAAATTAGNLVTPGIEAFAELPLGSPVVLQVTHEDEVPDTSSIRVGVYEGVALAQYQFPPVPDPLPSISPDWLTDGDQQLGTSRFLAVTSTATAGIAYPTRLTKGLQLEALTVAPGEIRVYADERLVWTSQSWDYSEAQSSGTLTLGQLGIQAGEEVTFRIEAERFPEAAAAVWELRLYDAVVPYIP